MTQQFGNSLEIQGNTDRFSSEYCLATVSVSPAVHSVKPKAKQKVKQKLKRKRGRPRKALPVNILSSDSYQNNWSSGQSVAEKKCLHDNYFVSDHIGEEFPFSDEELTTLDKFEKISRSVEKISQSVERNTDCSYDIKRIDQPAATPVPVSLPQQKKILRRRQIDPSTCERDYSQDEVEFMNALNEYKRTSGRMFPTCSEILEVLKCLGYEKQRCPIGI
ncbi:MAG: hypothetical protein LBK82_08775 [Planctomycetaceae bacterium]|nr:hypothetical protein [Planctomycetaceae bacterium]